MAKVTEIGNIPYKLVFICDHNKLTKRCFFCFIHLVMIGKEIAPKTINDIKLINAGRILENNRTLAESTVPVGEPSGGVITMHVVVRPPQFDKENGNFSDNFLLLLFIFVCCLGTTTLLHKTDSRNLCCRVALNLCKNIKLCSL